MLVATRYFPTQLRGKVLGFIASTVAFGSGIGPIVGGFIAGTWHWRYLFLISLLTLFTIFFFNKWLPDEEKRSSNLDIKGAFLMGIAIATLLFALNQLFCGTYTCGYRSDFNYLLHWFFFYPIGFS